MLRRESLAVAAAMCLLTTAPLTMALDRSGDGSLDRVTALEPANSGERQPYENETSTAVFLSELAASTELVVAHIDTSLAISQARKGELELPSPSGVPLKVRVEARDMRGPGFVAGYFTDDGSFVNVELPFAGTYRGKIVSPDTLAPLLESEARLTITNNGVQGYVRGEFGTLNIEPLASGRGGLREHALYFDESVVMPHTNSEKVARDYIPRETVERDDDSTGDVVTTGTIRLVLGADEGYVDNHGGATAAYNAMLSDLNQIEGIYAVNMNWQLESAWTTTIPDSAFACSGAEALLTGFQAYANSKATDLAVQEWNQGVLFYGGDVMESCSSSGSLFGLAYADGFAHGESYSIAQQTSEPTNFYFPSSNAVHRRYVLTHEMGHVQGGDHCRAKFVSAPLGQGTKTIVAPWATLQEEPSEPSCGDVPPDYLIYTEYNIVERFSDDLPSDNSNKNEIDKIVGVRLDPPGAPPAPSGPSSAEPLEVVTFTFDIPDSVCDGTRPGTYLYIQIDWGDGAPARPPESEKVCNLVTRSHTWSALGTFSVRYRIKEYWLGPWSPWSATSIALACLTNDLGPLCDAPNDISSAVSVPRGDTQGYVRNGDPGDFYKFKVSGGSDIKVKLTVPACENYDFELYRPDGTRVDTSYQSGCTLEEVTAEDITQYGEWSVFVFGVGGSHSMDPYILNVFAGNVIRDDDSIRDTSYIMDAFNDEAEKRLVLGSNALGSASSAKLFLNGRSRDCSTTANSHRFLVNSVAVLDFVGCSVFPGSFSNYRDDDGTTEVTYVMNGAEDVAVKRINIPAGGLTDATTTRLWIFAKTSGCGASGANYRLFVNGATVGDFNPCDTWSSTAHEWKYIRLDNTALFTTGSNSIEIEKISGGANDRNMIFEVDSSTDYGRTDASYDGVNVNGELAWYLDVTRSKWEWPTINVPLNRLSAGTTNSFEVRELADDYLTQNIQWGIDSTNDAGRTDASTNGINVNGELMWVLYIE